MNLEEKKEMEKLLSKKALKLTTPFIHTKGIVIETPEGIRLYPIKESMDYYLFNSEDIQVDDSDETTFYEGKEVPVKYVNIKNDAISCRVTHRKIVFSVEGVFQDPSGIRKMAAMEETCDPDWGWGAWFYK